MKNLKLIVSCIILSFVLFQQTFSQTSVASGLNWVTTGGVASGCPCGPSSISVLGATGQGGCIKLQTGGTGSGPGGDIFMLLGSGPNGYGRFLLGTSTSSTPLTISATGAITTTGAITGGSLVSTGGITFGGNTLSSTSGNNGHIANFQLDGRGGLRTTATFGYDNGIIFNALGASPSVVFKSEGSTTMTISPTGNVGIGCTSPAVKLAVNGKIQASEVEIKSGPCSDYVFEKNYKLMSLAEVEKFVTTNKHLPEVPSAKEFEQNGYSIGQMDDVLLRKVEELTLYVIEQNKRIEALEQENKALKNK